MIRKILFFGSNGRLGQEIVRALKADYAVTAVDVHEKSNSEVERYWQLDSLNDLERIYRSQSFDAVIHCQQIKPAGFTQTNLLNLEMDEFDRVLDVNLRLSFLSTQLYLKSISQSDSTIKGRIINFVSTYSVISSNPTLYDGTEMGNPVHYTISKAGLLGLTKYVAANIREYGVLCNSISPHGIENNQSSQFKKNFSNRNPIGRLSAPNEVLPAVRFLLDEDNTYVNGANIAVDGGWTAC